MRIGHLKEMTANALIANYLTSTNSSVVFIANGDQVRSKLTRTANIVQSTLTGLVVPVGACVALFITIKCMPGADDPRERSEVYHVVGRIVGLVALVAAVI